MYRETVEIFSDDLEEYLRPATVEVLAITSQAAFDSSYNGVLGLGPPADGQSNFLKGLYDDGAIGTLQFSLLAGAHSDSYLYLGKPPSDFTDKTQYKIEVSPKNTTTWALKVGSTNYGDLALSSTGNELAVVDSTQLYIGLPNVDYSNF